MELNENRAFFKDYHVHQYQQYCYRVHDRGYSGNVVRGRMQHVGKLQIDVNDRENDRTVLVDETVLTQQNFYRIAMVNASSKWGEIWKRVSSLFLIEISYSVMIMRIFAQ